MQVCDGKGNAVFPLVGSNPNHPRQRSAYAEEVAATRAPIPPDYSITARGRYPNGSGASPPSRSTTSRPRTEPPSLYRPQVVENVNAP